MAGGVLFLLNVCALTEESFELGHKNVVRRATAQERTAIKSHLGIVGGEPFGDPSHLWECRLPLEGVYERLPENEWRYFVFGFPGDNESTIRLTRAASLCVKSIEVGFTILDSSGGAPGGLIWNHGRLFQYLQRARAHHTEWVKIDLESAAELASIHREIDHAAPEVARRVESLSDELLELDALPIKSPQRVLGLFALLELLLAHQPKPSDPYDSITRQIKKKITLLDRRWVRPLDYSPFGKVQPEVLWGKLYQYRSRIAHGGAASIDAELAVLQTPQLALSFLHEAVKRAVGHVLLEPQLMADLREC